MKQYPVYMDLVKSPLKTIHIMQHGNSDTCSTLPSGELILKDKIPSAYWQDLRMSAQIEQIFSKPTQRIRYLGLENQ